MINKLFLAVMFLNAVWFGAGFWLFSLKSAKAAKLIVSKQDRTSPLFSTITHALKFLGGMNLGMAILSIVAFLNPQILDSLYFGSLLALAFGITHGLQFRYNVPIAIKESNNQDHPWPVLKGTMYFIFIVDASLALLNFILAAIIII